jgi:glycosyltransferase involved in cell wall biosynthesis
MDRPDPESLDWIYRSYADSRLKVYSEVGIGLVQNLNYGVRHAQGKYIVRMDSDDIMMPNRISKQVNFLENKPAYGAVGGGVIQIDEDNKEIKRIYYPHRNYLAKLRLSASSPIAHPALTVRQVVMEEVGGYLEEEFPAEDFGLLTRMGVNWKIGNLKEQVIYHRIHHNSVSARLSEAQLKKTLSVIESNSGSIKMLLKLGTNRSTLHSSKTGKMRYTLSLSPKKATKFFLYLLISLLPKFMIYLGNHRIKSKRDSSLVEIEKGKHV